MITQFFKHRFEVAALFEDFNRVSGKKRSKSVQIIQKKLDFFRWGEITECFKWGQRDGHLRFIVGVFVYIGILSMKPLRQFFIGVGLDAEGLLNGQHFKQEWQVWRPETVDAFFRENGLRVFFKLWGERLRGHIGMCAHPEFCVRFFLVLASQQIIDKRVAALLAPRVVLHTALERNHGKIKRY